MKNSFSHNNIIYFIPVIVWMCFIYALSSRQHITVAEEPMINFLIFKTLHVVEYTIIYVLNVFALKKNESRHPLLYAGYITILFAITDELHQMAVPTREGIFRDVLIDSVGVGTGNYILNKFQIVT